MSDFLKDIHALKDGNSIWLNTWSANFVQQIYDDRLFIKRNENDDTICLSADVSFMSLNELCEFARHLVQLHIDIARFNDHVEPTVGGNIHIFAVSPNQTVKEFVVAPQSIGEGKVL